MRLYNAIGRELARKAAENGPCFVETTADGFPWTKEGCNTWGKRGDRWGFIPYASRTDAQAAIDARLHDRTEFDDPMWGTAECRIVPTHARKS